MNLRNNHIKKECEVKECKKKRSNKHLKNVGTSHDTKNKILSIQT